MRIGTLKILTVGNRGGSRGGRGGNRGGRPSYGGRDEIPQELTVLGTFMHASENEMVCKSTNEKIPHFNAGIYLENKTKIGHINEILGPINEVYFTIKVSEGIVATSFQQDAPVYIGTEKLLPLERFLPKEEKPKQKVKKASGGAPRGRGGRGGRGNSRGGRGNFQSRGGDRNSRGGFRGGRGGFRGRQ
ncbi:Gar1-domain-containing protein [Rozella allomycis CSF55]|uniref:H/ACA ribonucleoprotein complex subunit n=1 Tax=Rozella allomycis (strain CSF55) TaxID=988480 RepID=A0A075B309_ROZAC|nr:H/ACA ribonucleoprotein complex, subunit Gar1/Naf1 domain-containing protein [Rozella allomycis CSF55]RKP21799.1 Gar1-domain-containing protein [Rozella allomycis CSF55]|eukprot:EPZ35168.1 H/ACA ribonucleoprotein complex, subunit Gar1/Naf1 domain-containing protein [Rozella allomycis CSF55]